MQPTMIYQPRHEHKYRVTWYGGESTQLHFERYRNGEWEDRDVRTLGSGVPGQVKEMLIVMEDYYHDSLILEEERLHEMM